LEAWTGSDRFGDSVTIPAGSSKIEPGITPKKALIFSWAMFSDTANDAGISRRYGGIHFRLADIGGRLVGRLAATKAWAKAQSYFDGTAKATLSPSEHLSLVACENLQLSTDPSSFTIRFAEPGLVQSLVQLCAKEAPIAPPALLLNH
jgi:hypothetical protein